MFWESDYEPPESPATKEDPDEDELEDEEENEEVDDLDSIGRLFIQLTDDDPP